MNTIISTNHSILLAQEELQVTAFYSDNGELICSKIFEKEINNCGFISPRKLVVINHLISVYEIDLVRKEFVYLKSILNKISQNEIIHITPIDSYSAFYIYAEFDSFVHCF